MRYFPHWIKAYIEHTKHLEAPDSFHFWTAVSTIAGALERKVWIDHVNYEFVPNFYIVFVGIPGEVKKTSSTDVGMQMLTKIPGVCMGPRSLTWEALVSSLEAATRGIILDAQTGEKYSMSAMTIQAGELGTLVNWKDQRTLDVLTDLWDGKRDAWKKATRTMGNNSVINPWLNIIGCTTPTWIANNLGDATVGGGFVSRIIFVHADRKRRPVCYPEDHIPYNYSELHEQLLSDLKSISKLFGPYKLLPEAKAVEEPWYNKMHMDRDKLLANPRLAAFTARKQVMAEKLAMILAAAQRDELIITADDIQTAIVIVDALEGDIATVFENIGQTPHSRLRHEMVGLIRSAGGVVERRALLQRMLRSMSESEFNEQLQTAVSVGEIELVPDPRGQRMFIKLREISKPNLGVVK